MVRSTVLGSVVINCSVVCSNVRVAVGNGDIGGLVGVYGVSFTVPVIIKDSLSVLFEKSDLKQI